MDPVTIECAIFAFLTVTHTTADQYYRGPKARRIEKIRNGEFLRESRSGPDTFDTRDN